MKPLPGGKTKRLVVAVSLIVHGVVLLSIFAMPAQKIRPPAEVIQVHLAALESRPVTGSQPYKAALSAKPEQKRSIGKQIAEEVMPDAQMTVKAVAKEEQATPGPGHVRETGNAAKATGQGTGAASAIAAANAGTQAIRETRFGEAGAPSFLHREAPVYPLLAQRMGREGRVVLKLSIDAGGQLRHIDVVESSWSGFTDAAVTAVQKSRFSPAYRDGRAVASLALLSVRFNLKKGA